MADQEPLWKVMESAFIEGRNPGYCDRRGYAAEIRAIAEWLWKQGTLDEVAARADVIKMLFAEADRAEAGE